MTGIACITVNTLDRRIDVGLPDGVPVADLLPTLLRHGGTDLADRGAAHGGWVVRRADGAELGSDLTLKDQGVRDGDALWIVGADEVWPEPEYDDIAEAIVATAGRRGRVWDARATRIASIGTAAVMLAAAIPAVVRSGPPWTGGAAVAAGVAAALLLAGVLAARLGRDAGTGTALGALGAGYAFLAGLLAPRYGPIGGSQLLAGSVAMIGYAVAGIVGVGKPRAPMVAALVAGVASAGGSAVVVVAGPAGGAAVTLGVLALGVGLAPSLAMRLGGLLVPDLAGGRLVTGAWESVAVPVSIGSGPIDSRRVDVAVARTDDLLIGLLCGVAVTVAGAATVLAVTGGWAARALLAVVAAVLALRARAYPAVRQRLAGLAAGAASAVPLLATVVLDVPSPLPLVAALGAVAVATALGGGVARRSPAIGRFGDIVETTGIVAVLPLVCVILGLFTRARGLGA